MPTAVDRLHVLSYGDVLRELRRSRPLRTAIVDGSVRLSYPALDDRVNRLSNALAAAGAVSGERVLWLGQNSFRLLELFLAAAKLGGSVCAANWRQSAEELRFVVEDFDARVVVWQGEQIGDAVAEARSRTGSPGLWIQHDDEGDDGYEAFVASGDEADPDLLVDPSAPLLTLYTAAFEGRPNGATLSHTALLMQDLVIGRVLDVTHESVYLNSGPLFHIATFMSTTATFHHGGTNVFTARADAEEICRLVEAERCTHGFIPGPTIEQMRDLNADGRFDLSSMFSAPDAPEWKNPMVCPPTSPWGRRPGGYGQTEVVGLATFAAMSDGTGTSGRPSPICSVRVVDDTDNEVASGEVGEIVVQGPLVMVGYHDRSELNDRRSRDGWHHTHDLGRREPDGSISFIGPKTTMIKSAAENVYPAEVEACIMRHPAVAEVCVIGVPDPKWTQNVKAVVVLKEDASATADDIIEHCRASIASYKKPRIVEFTDSLPKAGFFVDREAVDALFGGGGYPGVGR